MFVLAHLSDPHLAPLPLPHPSELALKRVLGLVNWYTKRIAIHRAEVVAAIVADLKRQSPAHVAVTGDLVNIALPREFVGARRWLDALGTPQDVSLVPGNHDAYVRAMLKAPELQWGDYMSGDAGETVFPFVRRRGPLALIGVSTAVATAPVMATGWLGEAQLRRLSTLLAELSGSGLFRVVLIHHPPAGERGAHKRLTDAVAVRQVLQDHGAELVLHGHDHIASLNWLDGPRGQIPVIGVPSASASASGSHTPAAYNLYQIDNTGSGWRIEVISRGLSRDSTGQTRPVDELNRHVIDF